MITQLQFKCPTCSKKANTIGEFSSKGSKFYILNCGHFTAVSLAQPTSSYDNFTSLELDKPYKFQIEGMEFAQNSNGRCLIADEMGLGKTIQALGYLFFQPKSRPALIVVKKKLTVQWLKQIYRWCNKSYSQIIQQGHAILPGMEYYIISMDLLRNYPLERFEKVGIKTLVIDECQHFNNAASQRTHFLRKFITEQNIERIIALSGTPFKNRLSEYFTILNILAPQYFQNKEEFTRRYINYYYDSKGKLREMGLKNKEHFMEITKNFVLRRERKDVAEQIPYVGIQRNIQYVDLEDKYAEAYNNAQEDFLALFEKIDNQKSRMGDNSDLLAILQRMRHIVGLSKIPDTIDFVTDFLLSSDEKIIIFLHHQDVARMMIDQLNNWCRMGGFNSVLAIRGNMPEQELSDVVDKFSQESNGYRIVVASTLAAGEGLDKLQHACSNLILMERQWNAANEEQVEARLVRIGQKKLNVISTYMTAGGTIDEMLTEINERKRALVKSGMLSKDQTGYSESEMIRQLYEMIEKKKAGVKWKLN